MYPDLLIWRQDIEHLVIEIKGFDEEYSSVRQLIEAAGQYLVYRATMGRLNLQMPIYLAVPHVVLDGILDEPLGKLVIEDYKIKLLVVDFESQVVVQWID